MGRTSRRALTVVLASLLVTGSAAVAQEQQIFGVVVAESTALRANRNTHSRVLRMAHAGDEFRWLAGSQDRGSARVVFGSTPFIDTVWVNAQDTYIEWPEHEDLELDLHLSLMEVPSGVLKERIPPGRYLQHDSPLPRSYWVDAVFAPTKSRFTVGARVYRPGRYFSFGKDAKKKDSLYGTLYARDAIRPVFRLSSVWRIATVHERLLLTRGVADRDDCYESHFLRTESKVLIDTVRTVQDYDIQAIDVIPTSLLWSRTRDGEPVSIKLTYVLEITPVQKRPGPPIRIARCVGLIWASCL